MANFDDVSFTQMTFTEGSAPTTPATSNWKIYTKTDGLYVIDDAGTETGPLGAGGGGASVPAWMETLAAPASADGDDQEFTGTIGGTAVTPTGTATWTQSDGLLSVYATGQSSADICPRLYALTSPSAPLTIETRVRAAVSATTAPGVGICFTDGTTAASNAVAFYIYRAGATPGGDLYSGTITNQSSSAGLIGGVLGAHPYQYEFYMRLTWVSSNTFSISVSIDGVTWTDFAYGNQAKTLTPTHMGVFATSWGAGHCLASFEYLRRS